MQERPTVLIPSYLDPQRALRAAAAAQEGQPVPLRTVIVDDGSPDEPWRDVVLPEATGLVRRGSNGGFAPCVNTGLDSIPDGDVVLLNSDVVLAPGWLPHVQETARRFRTAVVGIRLHYPDGAIQHAGGVPLRGGWFGHVGDGDRLHPTYGMVSGAPFVTGAFWYWTREALDRLGWLDQGYRNGVEDIDYCVRAWRSGFVVMYDGRAHGLHECGATRRAAGMRVGREAQENVRRFAEKHWRVERPPAVVVPHA